MTMKNLSAEKLEKLHMGFDYDLPIIEEDEHNLLFPTDYAIFNNPCE